jgi:hypothetical protein
MQRGTVTVAQISQLPNQVLVNILHGYLGQRDHFTATRAELIYDVARLYSQHGMLTPHDAGIIESPYFGLLYANNHGSRAGAFNELLTNLII